MKKNNLIKVSTSLIAVVIYISSCNIKSVEKKIRKQVKNELTSNLYEPPIKGMDIKPISFTFKAEEGVEFFHSSGSKVSIPVNSIVDEKGNPVKGNIEVKYREFKTVKDVFFSGIPMKLNSTSNKYLESMGMAEIKGYKNGKPVFLKKNSGAFVDVSSSIKPGKQYKSWFLDSQNNWNEIANNTSYSKDDLINEQKKLIDELNLSGNKVFRFNLNSKRFPELKKWKGVYWELNDFMKTSYTVGNINVDAIHSIERVYKPRYIDSIEMKTSENIKGNYTIKIHCMNRFINSMIKDKSVCYVIDAKPLYDKQYIKSKIKYYDSLEKNYKSIEKAYARNIERLKTVDEESFVNRIQMQYGFGIYNCDAIQSINSFSMADFRYKDKGFNKVYIGLVSSDNARSVVELGKYNNGLHQVPVSRFSDYKKMFLFSNLPNNDIAFIGFKTYQKQIRNQYSKMKHFKMKKMSDDQFWDMLDS